MGNAIITCLLIYAFIFFNIRWCSCNENSPNNNSTLKCIPSERAALLNFKHNLTYFEKDALASWVGEECCRWMNVGCDNTTGHILEINLNLNAIDKFDPLVYLLELKQLEHLDLSYNNFNYSSIPRFMGSMKQLRYLDLSVASIGGLVPYELGNLTNLQFLKLSDNMLSGQIPASFGKLSTLTTLDLSNNKLSGEIPASFGDLFNLNVLYLFGNNLSSIASSLRFPSNLESLDLSNNQLSGKISTSIGNLSKLQSLDISFNLLEGGKMPTSIFGKLSKLQRLDISHNPLLRGTILSETHLANLSSLTDLDMSDTMLTLNLSSDWIPPFQLQSLHADTCKINGQLPTWLQTQQSLSDLSLSDANIPGLIPRWFHTMQQLEFVDLSKNKLTRSPIFPINFVTIDISNNFLSGSFFSNGSELEIYGQADVITLSNNIIAGPFPEGLSHIMPNLGSLILDNNQISGPIPNSFCHMSLNTLDLERNRLSGVIPNCWSNISSMSFINLSHNKLKGPLPCFNEIYYGLIRSYLHLNDNLFSGEIPSCFNNLANLEVLDLGGNQLSGKMNKWFSVEKFNVLKILRLRGNKLSGTIPKQICSLPYLQLMDLGNNHFTGSIPRCLSNLTAMTSPHALRLSDLDGVSEVIQGIERAYTSTLPYLVDIDLSCNNLVGSIPDDITKISGLLSLNLSYNQLSGTIPVNIGGLKSLVSLDLSNNKLRGSIPPSIGELSFLSHLDLSYNNLSGPIPTGNQLQTLSDQASIYAGNPYLCGDFMPRKCKSKADELGKGSSDKGNGDKEKKLKKMGFDLVVVSGFATGFWGVVGCLVLNSRWRHEFFRRVEDGYNWLYVIVVMKMRVLKAKINRR